MLKRSKNYVEAAALINPTQIYKINEAITLAQKTKKTKFDSTIEVVFRLNLDPKYAEQNLRGALVLPKGTGKTRKILVITNTKQKEAQEAKADLVGAHEVISQIQKGDPLNFDIIIATPEMMGELGKIGKILGPKGLMPNAKLGTVTTDVNKAISDIRKGKVEYRVDKHGNIHAILGVASFKAEDLEENYYVILNALKKAKPHTVKGVYIKNISISTTMGPGIKVAIEH